MKGLRVKNVGVTSEAQRRAKRNLSGGFACIAIAWPVSALAAGR